MQSGYMRYVICPSCGDAVAGKLPDDGEDVECLHCHRIFPFRSSDARSGVVTYDDRTDRWQVHRP